MKKIFAIALVLALVFSLAACGGGGDGAAGGDGTGGGAPASPVSSEDEDPCPCCPDCIQAECVCEECGGNDDYDCKCSAPEAASAKTYDIEVKTVWKDRDSGCPYPDECGGETVGSVRVTMDPDGAGYFGVSRDGTGEYISYNSHYWDSEGRQMLGHAAPGTSFNFSAMLSVPGKSDAIKVGFDFSGEDDVTMNWPNGEVLSYWGMMGQIHGFFSGTYTIAGTEFDTSGLIDPETFAFDDELGMFVLEMPLADGEMQQTFSWDSAKISMTITLTPAD